MGKLTAEFEFLIEKEQPEIEYNEYSLQLVEQAENFLIKCNKYNKVTWQGISVMHIADSIQIKKNDIIPWIHTKMTLDVSKLRTINKKKLTELTIPTFVEELCSIEDLGDSGFGYNQTFRNYLNYIKIAESILVIAPNTFALYKKLEKIEFEDNSRLTYIGSYAFAYCESLKEIDLRKCKKLDELSSYMLSNSGIETLKISSYVQTVDENWDAGTEKLKTVYIDDDKYTITEFTERLSNCENNQVFWYVNNII